MEAKNRTASEPNKGWLFALSQDPDRPSSWGSIEGFFDMIEDYGASDPIVIDSDVWGKMMSRPRLSPTPGDGFAFYHTTRAIFPPHDNYGKRPRISLVGRLLEIRIVGRTIEHIRVQVDRSTLNSMLDRPIVRTSHTEYLFRACMGGQTATLYEISPQVWKTFTGFLGLPVEESRRSASGTGTSIAPPRRIEVKILRVVRDTLEARRLKDHYDYRCQLCRERIECADGSHYAEVHHIRPIGGSHGGQDIWENMLVLCPNHHAMFDLRLPRFLSVNEVKINEVNHRLTLRHALDPKNTDYHNRLVGTTFHGLRLETDGSHDRPTG
jgi:hypothetical protein